MSRALEQEAARLVQQRQLDRLKGAAERNEWGQFATPPALAQAIAEFSYVLWKSFGKGAVRFLDPAVGTGAFYSALKQAWPNDSIRSATGVELDPRFAQAANDLWGRSGLHVVERDFTDLAPTGRANLILTNPPYIRHHHIGTEKKAKLRDAVYSELGLRINGLAGLYCYFMLLADKWLDEDGLSVWLVPTEFMSVKYGKAIKDYLLRRVTLLHVHRYCPSDVQFADALVSSAVVCFRKSAPPANHSVRFAFGGQLSKPQSEQYVTIAELTQQPKWTIFPELRPGLIGDAPPSTVTLGELFSIKRGIATGDNKFFVLPRVRAKELGIAEHFFKPILPSPRYLSRTIIDADRDGYPRLEPQLCVIDCEASEGEICTECPGLSEYLEHGKRLGVHAGYLASRRMPWYSQEKRDPAPFLCTYMGRPSRTKNRSPFRFLWNKSHAIAANVYLLLYPKGALKRLLKENPSTAAHVFEALTQIGSDACVKESRVYGGGLYKLEPSELARVPAEPLRQLLGDVLQKSQQALFK